VDIYSYDSPHSKTNLLLQAHFSHLKFWIPDYITDLKSVLDQAIRILQAIIDISADGGWLWTTFNTIELLQMVMQGQWSDSSTLNQLPYFGSKIIDLFNKKGIYHLPELLSSNRDSLTRNIESLIPKHQQSHFWSIFHSLPIINIVYSLNGKKSKFKRGEEIGITITMERLSKYPSDGAYTPKFPKRKEEGWYLIIGDPVGGELIALKRVNCSKRSTVVKLTFDAPEELGHFNFCLYLMCDVYLGLDQQYPIDFEVIK